MLQSPSDDTAFHRIVDALYEAVLDPTQMPIALTLLSIYTDAENAHYLVWDKHTDAPRHGATSNWCSHCPPQPDQCSNLCHALPPMGDEPTTNMTLMDTPDLRIMMRLHNRSGISEANLAKRQQKLERIQPHLQRAARMQQHDQALSELAALGMAGLDTLDFGVMVVERGMRVKYANAWVRAMTQADSCLSLDHGRLHALDPSHDAALRALIEQAARSMGAQGTAGSWMYLARDGQPVPVIVTPLMPSDSLRSTWMAPLALMLIGNSRARSVMDASVLASLFSLTNKECIIAARLAAGETLQDIAEREFLSLHTVRVHVRDILRKTSTHRQSELVRLLHLLPSVDLERAGATTPMPRRRSRLHDISIRL